VKFATRGTEDIFNGVPSRAARKTLPIGLHKTAADRLDLVVNARDLTPFQRLPGYRFEALKGDRKGQFSIRINEKYRICFAWNDEEAVDIEIVDYHP
jgi:toxin HigB-1